MRNEVSKEFGFHKKGKYVVGNRIFLDLVFNNKCNFNCPFCIARTKSYSDSDLGKWKKAIKKTLEVFKEEIDSLIILGGEATVDPDFFVKLDYIDEITKDNHIFTILTTNGYMLKNDKFLEKSFLGLDHFDSASPSLAWMLFKCTPSFPGLDVFQMHPLLPRLGCF